MDGYYKRWKLSFFLLKKIFFKKDAVPVIKKYYDTFIGEIKRLIKEKL